MNRPPLPNLLHQQISRAYVGAVDEHRAKLRLELARFVRQGDDAQVQRIIAELGPVAEQELDDLEDRGVSIPTWGVSR